MLTSVTWVTPAVVSLITTLLPSAESVLERTLPDAPAAMSTDSESPRAYTILYI